MILSTASNSIATSAIIILLWIMVIMMELDCERPGRRQGSTAADLTLWQERHRRRGSHACTGDCRSSLASPWPIPGLAATRFPHQQCRRDVRWRSQDVDSARRSMARGVPEATTVSVQGGVARCCERPGSWERHGPLPGAGLHSSKKERRVGRRGRSFWTLLMNHLCSFGHLGT